MQITDIKFQDPEIQFFLPGAGDKHEDCGQFYTLGHFPSPGVVHWHKRIHSCHRRECPVCWHDWQHREAQSITRRLLAYQFQYGERSSHYVLSPPQNVKYGTKKSFRALRQSAYKIAKVYGIHGGVIMFHERSARGNEEEYIKAHCSKGPHFHILGVGWLQGKYNGEWVVKNLRVRRSSGQVYGTAFYILDHLAIPTIDSGISAISHSTDPKPPRLNAITWFGVLSYNRFKIPEIPKSEMILCPECLVDIPKMDWFIMSWSVGNDPPESDHGSSELAPNTIHVVRPLSSWNDY